MGYRPDTAEQPLDAVFSALAHPVRRSILRLLVTSRDDMAMSDVAGAAGISPQLLNKHAASLEAAGLIAREAVGREKHVRARPQALASARDWIEETNTYWNSQLDSLEDYISSLGGTATQQEGS